MLHWPRGGDPNPAGPQYEDSRVFFDCCLYTVCSAAGMAFLQMKSEESDKRRKEDLLKGKENRKIHGAV